jgi:hypothetical protein
MHISFLVALTSVLFFVFSSAANAVTITSWQLNDCDDQGCEGAKISLQVEGLGGNLYREGAKISLQVEGLGGNLYRVTQGLNLTMYDSGPETPMTTVQAVDWKALKDVVDVDLTGNPGGTWGTPQVDSNVTGQGCGGNGNDKICTSATSSDGVAFTALSTDGGGWSYWVYDVVATGGVLPVLDQHYGLDYGPATGRLISGVVPEPSASLVFAVGLGVVGSALRKRRS